MNSHQIEARLRVCRRWGARGLVVGIVGFLIAYFTPEQWTSLSNAGALLVLVSVATVWVAVFAGIYLSIRLHFSRTQSGQPNGQL